MRSRGATYGALARALAPPRGEADAFAGLGLPPPDADRLAIEHVALFGRAGRPVLSPYEGAHRDTSLHALLAAYADARVEPDPSFRDRADHVSVELAVLSVLVGREVGAAGKDPSSPARTFFVEHIQPWVPALFERMAEEAGFPAHRALAVAALRALREEGARYGSAAPTGRAPRIAPSPLCTGCGRPLGVVPPAGPYPRPSWGTTCIQCRIGADLRRTTR